MTCVICLSNISYYAIIPYGQQCACYNCLQQIDSCLICCNIQNDLSTKIEIHKLWSTNRFLNICKIVILKLSELITINCSLVKPYDKNTYDLSQSVYENYIVKMYFMVNIDSVGILTKKLIK